ncbi:hypothetical protein [Pelagibacterium mangrovi]
MPVETIIAVVGVIAIFGLFGVAVGYASIVGNDRAITLEEERAARV